MIQKATLWSRIGSWIKPYSQDDDLPALAKTDLESISILTSSNDNGRRSAKGGIRLMPWRKRDEMLEGLQHGYDKVVELVTTIQDHLQGQNKRSDRVAELLAEMARGVKDLPHAARHQTETLNSLVGQLEISNRHAQSMVNALGDWPTAAMAQREALHSIAQQLGASSDATGKLTDRLESLAQTTQTLSESSHQQVNTLKAMQQASQQHDSHLARMVHMQTRRFTMLFLLTLGLTLIAVVCAGLSLLS